MTGERRSDENLGQKVYAELQLRLIVGDLAPDDTLSIRTLAEEFGVSAMPVREALKRLEAEKALIGSAKRAYRVPVITPRAASDLFFVRATLEGAAAELAVGHMTPARLAQLAAHSDAMEQARRGGDARALLLDNFRFHSLIYRSSGNPDLSELAEMLYARSGPWLARAIRDMADHADWGSDHRKIIDALAAGDRSLVRRLIEADVNWGTAFFRSGKARAGP